MLAMSVLSDAEGNFMSQNQAVAAAALSPVVAMLKRYEGAIRTVLIDKRNVPAVAEAPMLVADAETDVVRAEAAPSAIEMVRQQRHRQARGNHG